MKKCCCCLGVTIKQNIVVFRGHQICLNCLKLAIKGNVTVKCKSKECTYESDIDLQMKELTI